MPTFLSLLALFFSAFTMQGGMDLAVAQKWSEARIVKYHVVGVHKARASIVFGDYEGKADVLDQVTVDFTWEKSAHKISGLSVVDSKSVLSNLKSDGTNCPPPQLKGDYEHFQSVSNSINGSDQIQLTGTRTFPAASVSNYPGSCSMRSIAGGTEQALLWVAVVGPEALGMPTMPGSPITVSADRKSFSVPGAENWVWTYTPTLVQ